MDNLTKRLNELESKRGTFIGSNEYIEGFKEAMKLSEDFIKQLKKLWREVLNDLNSVPEVNKSSVPEKEVTNEMIKNKIWENAKPANEYPKDWLVIPVLDVIELLKEDEISLCKSCYCMTKTIKDECGKCGGKK
jgi:seryl-tRNA synthetase